MNLENVLLLSKKQAASKSIERPEKLGKNYCLKTQGHI